MADAKKAIDYGVDGIVVSNHAGRHRKHCECRRRQNVHHV